MSYFVLPNSLETASFLTAEEKEFGRERLMLDNPRSVEGYVAFLSPSEAQYTNLDRTLASEAESFKWSEVRRGVLDVQVWLSASAYFAILSGLYSFGLFVGHMAPVLCTEHTTNNNSFQRSSKILALPKMPTRFSCGLLSPMP